MADVWWCWVLQFKMALVEFLRRLSGNPALQYDDAVARSELATASRNRAMGHFMHSFGNLKNPVDAVIEAYCRHCAIRMNCVDLASRCWTRVRRSGCRR